MALKLHITLREKCPNTDLYLVFYFGLNTGKYGPEKTPHLDTFQAVLTAVKNKQKEDKNLKYKMQFLDIKRISKKSSFLLNDNIEDAVF